MTFVDGVLVMAAGLAALVLALIIVWLLWVVTTVVLRLAVDGGAPGLWRASFGDIVHAAVVIGWRLQGRSARGAPTEDPATVAGSDVVVVMVHGTAADGTCMRLWAQAAWWRQMRSWVQALVWRPASGCWPIAGLASAAWCMPGW